MRILSSQEKLYYYKWKWFKKEINIDEVNKIAVQTKRLDNYVPDNINQKEINNNEQISKLRLPLIKNKSNDQIKNGQFYLCNSLPLDTSRYL